MTNTTGRPWVRVSAMLAAAALALLALASATSAAHRRPVREPCGPTGRHVLTDVRSSVSRVYRLPHYHGPDSGLYTGPEYYACIRGIRRQVDLGGTDCFFTGQVDHFMLSRSFVAFVVLDCGIDDGARALQVDDLASSTKHPRVVDPSPLAPGQVVSAWQFSSVVLSPDGAVAWIAEIGNALEVRKSDASGGGCQRQDGQQCHQLYGAPNVLLDSGPGIAAKSLRLHGSTLSWTHSGQQRTATLS